MTFKDFVGSGTTGIIGAVNLIVVPIIFTLAFLSFVYGVVNYFFLHGDQDAMREKGRSFIIWGVIGMAVLFTVWALVRMLLSTFGL